LEREHTWSEILASPIKKEIAMRLDVLLSVHHAGFTASIRFRVVAGAAIVAAIIALLPERTIPDRAPVPQPVMVDWAGIDGGLPERDDDVVPAARRR